MTKITVRMESIDGVRKRQSFSDAASARTFAARWVGNYPTIGRTYAVSDDGVCKVMVDGIAISKLFTDPEVVATAAAGDPQCYEDTLSPTELTALYRHERQCEDAWLRSAESSPQAWAEDDADLRRCGEPGL